MNSSFGKLNLADLGKGVLIAVGTVILTGIATSLQAGKLPTTSELGVLVIAGLGAGAAYLVKNIFTNSNNQLGTGEQAK